MPHLVPVKRALLSVSDKSGLGEFARALHREFGVELISTGGTAKFLREFGLPVKDVSEVTGFPEMMDGRVKTLHPKIHGGLLGIRDNSEHLQAMKTHQIDPIDLVCINLYPFAQTIAKPDCTFEEAIENIDIGGPSMVRSASKNNAFVTVVTSPADYDSILKELFVNQGATTQPLRLRLAQQAFAQTAKYDAMIAEYLLGAQKTAEADSKQHRSIDVATMPPAIELHLHKKQDLRYGENPHQQAALYVEGNEPKEASVAFAEQLHGKELSYINLLDADAALAAVQEIVDAPAACIVKHATPCGFAVGSSAAEAFTNAYAGDPLAAFGGIVALNVPLNLAAAQAITEGQKFLEVIVAPFYDADALELLKARWKNVRLLQLGAMGRPAEGQMHYHKIVGGLLVQQRDLAGADPSQWKAVSQREPTQEEMADLRIAWLACKHVKSNAIVLARDGMMVGAGGGQVDRVNACRVAVGKAGERAKGAVGASDAFFPFADGPTILLQAGVVAIVQPGGSMRDQETIDACNQAGAALVFTGQRHFKH